MRRIWQALLDEPLIAFALVGGLLFVLYGFREPAAEIETIEIQPDTIRALEQMQQDIVGRKLTDDERQEMIQGHIEDEVLMREAFRNGLEKKDSRVRKRLLNVMRSTIDQPVSEPTRAELQAYFRENQKHFEVGEVVSLDHVFFMFDSALEPENHAEFLAILQAGADHTQLGENPIYGNVLKDRTHDQLRRDLGKSFADLAFSLPAGKWNGPVETRQGIHYLRVTDKRQSAPPSFEQMEEYLRQDWMFRKRRELQTEKIAEIQKRYRILFTKE